MKKRVQISRPMDADKLADLFATTKIAATLHRVAKSKKPAVPAIVAALTTTERKTNVVKRSKRVAAPKKVVAAVEDPTEQDVQLNIYKMRNVKRVDRLKELFAETEGKQTARIEKTLERLEKEKAKLDEVRVTYETRLVELEAIANDAVMDGGKKRRSLKKQ